MRASDRGAMTRCLVLAVLALVYGAGNVLAQQANDPAQLQQALNRAQGLLRQLAEQRQQLEADNVAAQARVARLERDLGRERREGEELEQNLDSAERDKAALDRRLEGTNRRLEQVETRLTEFVAKYKELAGEHRALEATRDELENNLAATQAALADARQRNAELYDINHEILDNYMAKGSWQDFLQREPLLGLKQVDAENFEQDMRLQTNDQRLEQAGDVP